MRSFFSIACVLCVSVAVSWAAPATLLEAENSFISPINDQALISKRMSDLVPRDNHLRNRRSIEMLRRLCPELFQVIDLVIQNLTSTIFRVVGGALLRSGGLGGGGEGRSSVNVVLPTFPPDEDYDDDDEDEEDNKIDSDKSSNTTTTTTTEKNSNSESSSSSSVNEESELNRQVRTAREAQDQDAAASSSNVAPAPENDLSNVETDDADRDKRYSPFGGDSHGSGNFLFDLVRLITGSGAQDHSDAGAGGVAEIDVSPRAEHTEGIPGPITRLLVVANRGIANLIQDLILVSALSYYYVYTRSC
ncbi:uncharacterized protein LOC108744843 isoform X1 [Agrilus planipennis]|uniref:Uncharacterized protein LOC108744843 isoform X1 n=1 Tax=Agrilus planipennis TaxID=224129 RepID=A0A7F5R4M3_AGRPL|nr:uncharacterized protein LOC108744843 isoform X1 [Agrilus planipennis]XP_025830842.1 uncharacterized protein LOC108744843 isoform X1 [Agrilus planipennis]